MRLLITGAGGLLGGRLASLLAVSHAVTAGVRASPAPPGLPTTVLELDDDDALRRALDEARPEAVVHAGALADADACQRDPERARRVNVGGTETIARWCRAHDAHLVLLSTDLVLDGTRALADEDVPARPVLVYGRTKLDSEETALAEAPGTAVARVALVIGRGHGRRATATEAIAWALREGRRPHLFTDQHRTPIDPESVSDAIERILAGRHGGRFHLGGSERLSRHALGLRTAQALGLPASLIDAGAQADLRIDAPRPADVSLGTTRARRTLGWSPRPLDDAIRAGRPSPD